MFKYMIGLDGGGSKTRLICVDSNGNRIAETRTAGIYCRQDGVAAVIERLHQGLDELFQTAGITDTNEVFAGFGMPGYGENKKSDAEAVEAISRSFSPLRILFQNDVACAWAGATALQSGINLIAGTGSMSYGCDDSGRTARGGGWSEYFSDEGSGYWLGKKALELFAKQSDGRADKGPLYGIVRQHFGLDDDFEIVEHVESGIAGSRKETAELQSVLLAAARAGDSQALAAYAEAARELALVVYGAYRQLDFSGRPVRVSFVGGLINIGDLIVHPLKREIASLIPDAVFAEPLLGPCEGAILYAAQHYIPDELASVKEKLLAGAGI
jgi:N-acetylglucosamine kinase-like BadF-type ATPase